MTLKRKKPDQCSYSFYKNNYADGSRLPISIQKDRDKISVMLKGNDVEKERQLAIIQNRFAPHAIEKLHSHQYIVTITCQPFPLLEGSMQYLRANGMVVHHLYTPVDSPETSYILSDKILIKFATTASPEERKGVLDRYHLRLQTHSLVSDKLIVAELTEKSGAQGKNDKGKNPVKVTQLLQQEPTVRLAQVNLINRLTVLPPQTVQPSKTILSNDELFRYQWSLHSQNALSPQPEFAVANNAGISADIAWQLLGNRGDKNITIAIIDFALNFKHPDLAAQLCDSITSIKNNYVFHDGSQEISEDLLIGANAHGTECAGVALAAHDGKGVEGVAGDCRLLPVWLSANASDATTIRCFEKTAARADVISFSLAALPGKMIGDALFETLTHITTNGGPRGKGCVVVVCAGNNQVPINKKLTTAITYYRDNGTKQTLKKGTEIYNLYAAHPGVITVTACSSLNKAAAYNNFGAETSVCAPSADWELPKGLQKINSAGIYTTTGNGLPGTQLYRDDFCGTSAATPLVAGVAALILSANNQLTAKQVKSIIQETADKINPADAQYNANGHSERYGFGKINAAKAIQTALNMKTNLTQNV